MLSELCQVEEKPKLFFWGRSSVEETNFHGTTTVWGFDRGVSAEPYSV